AREAACAPTGRTPVALVFNPGPALAPREPGRPPVSQVAQLERAPRSSIFSLAARSKTRGIPWDFSTESSTTLACRRAVARAVPVLLQLQPRREGCPVPVRTTRSR